MADQMLIDSISPFGKRLKPGQVISNDGNYSVSLPNWNNPKTEIGRLCRTALQIREQQRASGASELDTVMAFQRLLDSKISYDRDWYFALKKPFNTSLDYCIGKSTGNCNEKSAIMSIMLNYSGIRAKFSIGRLTSYQGQQASSNHDGVNHAWVKARLNVNGASKWIFVDTDDSIAMQQRVGFWYGNPQSQKYREMATASRISKPYKKLKYIVRVSAVLAAGNAVIYLQSGDIRTALKCAAASAALFVAALGKEGVATAYYKLLRR